MCGCLRLGEQHTSKSYIFPCLYPELNVQGSNVNIGHDVEVYGCTKVHEILCSVYALPRLERTTFWQNTDLAGTSRLVWDDRLVANASKKRTPSMPNFRDREVPPIPSRGKSQRAAAFPPHLLYVVFHCFDAARPQDPVNKLQ
jgi:hypothetical protein